MSSSRSSARRLRPRPWARSALLLFCLVVGGAGFSAAELAPVAGRSSHGIAPARALHSRFLNQDPHYSRGPLRHRLHTLLTGATWLVAERRVAALPSAPPDLPRLHAARDATVTWIGHSTVLLQLDGVTVVTDPNWNDRSGPFGGLIGVGRYTPPGIRFEDLPRVDVVLVSHDHYDHLDEPTVRRLAREHDPLFVVPVGLKAWLAGQGISRAIELNWGETTTVRGVAIVCTPAQHGSGRGLHDQGERLWASWAVLGSKRFYFAGDTGYYDHFRQIGAALGPFDLAALPIGSYTPRITARPVHISPEEAVQAWQDLRARRMLGIHWGTFALAREPHDEPPRRLAAEVARLGLPAEDAWVLRVGQTIAW